MSVDQIARCALLCALPLFGATAPASASARRPDFRNPNSVAVLVTPRIALPHGFRPRRLVVPNVRFTFSGFDEKRQVRDDVARPLRRLFAAASAAGVPLAGVSGYRSEATQRNVYDYEYEPWHLRFVGVRLAREVALGGLALEQFFGAS